MRASAVGLAIVVATAVCGATAYAEEPVRHERAAPAQPREALTWGYRRVEPWQLIATFSAPLVIEWIEVGWGEASGPRFRGGVLSEEEVTEWLAADTAEGRDRADAISDAIQMGTFFVPLLVDGLISAYLIHGSPDVAWQVTAINLQAYATLGLVALGSIRLVARERPLAASCASDPEYSPLCNTQEEYRSFPSGHLATAVMGASLTCLHHSYLDLWGPIADELMCGTAIAASVADGVLRLVAARHYVTDLIAGAGVGLAIGWLVPWVLHYGQGTVSITPDVGDDRLGLTLRTPL
jgi:membrane-associated phospholipid phosphatase